MTAAAEAAPEKASRAAWVALVVLTLMNLLNYIDRFIVPAIQDDLKLPPMGLSDGQIGLLATSFLLVYTVTAPFFGAFGDRGNRPRLLALGVGIWSVATFLGGFATNFAMLAGSRAIVGIGEAAYATIAPAMLADHFPASMRGRILAIFYAATPVGAALGYKLGGYVSGAFGWQYAFFIAGVPGLIVALVAYRLPETAHRAARKTAGGIKEYLTLLKIKPYVLVVLGYAAYTFGLGGISVWMPSFLHREHGLDLAAAGNLLGTYTVITGFAGALIGGWAGDRLSRRWREGYMWLSGSTTLLAAPFAYFALTLRDERYLVALFIAQLLIFLSTGPVNSSILGVVPSTMRAASMALSIFAIHALGDGISPPIIGYLSEWSDLRQAVLVIPVAVAIGGVIWLYAAWRGERGPARGATT